MATLAPLLAAAEQETARLRDELANTASCDMLMCPYETKWHTILTTATEFARQMELERQCYRAKPSLETIERLQRMWKALELPAAPERTAP